jgi:glc operon protein GlcG
VVVDEGLPATMVRMDNAAVPAGVELPAAITAHGFVMMTGGVPIVAEGHIVGAIGVSSDTPDHDVQVANAGVAALTQ